MVTGRTLVSGNLVCFLFQNVPLLTSVLLLAQRYSKNQVTNPRSHCPPLLKLPSLPHITPQSSRILSPPPPPPSTTKPPRLIVCPCPFCFLSPFVHSFASFVHSDQHSKTSRNVVPCTVCTACAVPGAQRRPATIRAPIMPAVECAAVI